MTEQEPMAVVVKRIEIRQAIHPAGGQGLVLIAALFPNGNEVLIALVPDQARTAAATMMLYANEIDAQERRN